MQRSSLATAVAEPIPLDRANAPSPFIVDCPNPLTKPLPGYKLANEAAGQEYAVFTQDLIKSPNDDRHYRLVLLKNGMECLLIHDPKTDKSAAAMDVKVGHLSDPEDLQGLAHFCEHLMFMGTEKYPRESEYTEYLTQNAGSSNAFTGMDQTCYFFDVHPSALEGALDRFAQFFISPLFDPSCTEREANAVNSENSKNLQSDMWRLFQLDKSTSDRSHVYWRFGTGNRQTLWDEPLKRGQDVRARLIEWQKRHYSANIMKLCVLGKESLDELTRIVVEKFSPAENRNLRPPAWLSSPLGPEQLQKAILSKSIKDHRLLELTFPFPDDAPLYEQKPGSFLSHLIGHEGEGSLLSYLKGKGWANSVSAGAGNGASGFEFFKIHVDLTPGGLQRYKDVTAAIFHYISILKSTPPQEWVFEEVKTLARIAFRFKEKQPPSSTVMGTALTMSRPYPREKLLSAPHLSETWDPEVVQKAMTWLAPEHCRLILSAKEDIDGVKYDKKEQWYGTEYTTVAIPEEVMNGSLRPDGLESMKLPKPNQFVPKRLDIKEKQEVAQPAKRPVSLRNTAISRLWHKKDDRWWVPRAGVFFLLRSPLVDATPIDSLHARLFTELVKDSLVEYSYDADLAGLSYNFDVQADSITLTLDGYDDKLPELAQVVLERMRKLEIDPKRFELVTDQYRRALMNFQLEQPYNHAALTALQMTQETYWDQEQRLAVFDQVTIASLQNYIQRLLARLHMEILVHGNVLKDEAISIAELAENIIRPEALTPKELLSHRALEVPEGKWLYRKPTGHKDNANSAIEQFTYVGDVTNDVERAKLFVFATMIQDPVFDTLRTKEQLGYIVASGTRRSLAFMGLRVIVQSEKDAPYIESRVNQFWQDYRKTLEAMTDAEFEKFKETVINQRLEDHKNMWQESSHYWVHIHSGYYDFQQKERDVEVVKKLTKADIVEFFERHFFDNAERPLRRLSVYIDSQRVSPEKLVVVAGELQQAGVKLDEAQSAAFAASNPNAEQVLVLASNTLKESGKSEADVQAILGKLESILKDAPIETDVRLVTDRDAWRAQQKPCAHAHPVPEYAHLVPKL